jgi:hypothetical protein
MAGAHATTWIACRMPDYVLKFREVALTLADLWRNLRGSLAELTENFRKLIVFLKFA